MWLYYLYDQILCNTCVFLHQSPEIEFEREKESLRIKVRERKKKVRGDIKARDKLGRENEREKET